MAEEGAHVNRIDTSFGSIKPNSLGKEWLSYQFKFSVQLLRNLVRLQRQLQTETYDRLYFVASPSLLGHVRDLLTVAIARPHVRRIIAHVHNGNFQSTFKRGITRYSTPVLIRGVDRFVFSSQSLSDQLAEHIPPASRAVVHNTVDTGVQCEGEEVSRKIKGHAHRDIFRVLYLSNMIPSKGYQDLIHSAKHLVESGENSIQFDFVGDWPDQSRRDDLHAFLRQHELTTRVRVHGRVADRSTVRQFLLDADVFVLPTYYPNEAQPFSIIEAMNAGTPIIATPHASIPEYVEDDYNGYLVSKKAPVEIARAIRRLMDVENWIEKARAARQTYEDEFSPDAVKDQLFAAFSLDGNTSVRDADNATASLGVGARSVSESTSNSS